jgi:hypothetical protein
VPYYVYRVFPHRRLEKLAAPATFADASALAKSLRAAPDRPAECTIKVIFADNELGAEDLLSQVRERPPGLAGDE